MMIVQAFSYLSSELRTQWRPLLAIHLLVNLVIFVILSPLAALLLNFSVLASGEYALSDTELLLFLLSPSGLTLLMLMGTVGASLLMLEHAAMLVSLQIPDKRVHKVLVFTLSYLYSIALPLASLAGRIWLRCLAVIAVSSVFVWVIYKALLDQYDINYYLHMQPPEFVLAQLLAGGILFVTVLVLCWMLVGWAFALPLLLRGDGTAADAMKTSVQCTSDHRRAVYGWFLGWIVFSVVVTFVVAVFTWLAGFWLLPDSAQNGRSLILSLAILVGSGILFHFIASWLITSGFSLIVNGIFRKAYLALSTSKLELEISRRSLQKPGIRKIITFVIVLLVCMLISGRESFLVLKETTLSRPVEVVAHRGASAIAPENTIAAIQAAIESGADWVEIDVQMTSDGEIVVIHDSDLKKIGSSGLVVGTSTLEALRQVDIGSWFSPEFSDQRIPTLREVLELCDGRIDVIVEIKRYGVNEQLVPMVLGVVDTFADRNRIVVMSLDYGTIREVQAIDSSLKTGLLSSVAVGQLSQMDIDFLAINARGANRRLIREIRSSGKIVVVWTVNDALGISAMISRGVDAIITDNPALAVDILINRENYGPLGHLLNQFADLFDHPSLFYDQ